MSTRMSTQVGIVHPDRAARALMRAMLKEEADVAAADDKIRRLLKEVGCLERRTTALRKAYEVLEASGTMHSLRDGVVT